MYASLNKCTYYQDKPLRADRPVRMRVLVAGTRAVGPVVGTPAVCALVVLPPLPPPPLSADAGAVSATPDLSIQSVGHIGMGRVKYPFMDQIQICCILKCQIQICSVLTLQIHIQLINHTILIFQIHRVKFKRTISERLNTQNSLSITDTGVFKFHRLLEPKKIEGR